MDREAPRGTRLWNSGTSDVSPKAGDQGVDCASLPVPAVVGIPIIAGIGFVRLCRSPSNLHCSPLRVDSLAQSIELAEAVDRINPQRWQKLVPLLRGVR